MSSGDDVAALFGLKARFDAAFELCRGRKVVRPKKAVDACREVDLRIAFARQVGSGKFDVDPSLTFEQTWSPKSIGLQGIEAVLMELERELGIGRDGS